MAHAEKCPVCEGSGKYENRECHGCQGKGWVQVGDGVVPYVQPYPLISPWFQPMAPTWIYYQQTFSDSGTTVVPPLPGGGNHV